MLTEAWLVSRKLAFAEEPAGVGESRSNNNESEKEKVERVFSELREISERERAARQARGQQEYEVRSGQILWIAASSLIVGCTLGALFTLRARRGRLPGTFRNPFSTARREHEKALAEHRLRRTRAYLDLHLKLFPDTPRHKLPSIEALQANAGRDSGSVRYRSLQFEGITEVALPAFLGATAIVSSAAVLVAVVLRHSYGIETWADFSDSMKSLTPQLLTPAESPDTNSSRLCEAETAAHELEK